MRWLTSSADSGERLDKYLASHFHEARNQTAQWVRAEQVRVSGRLVTKPSLRLEGGEWIECEPPERDTATEMAPEEGALAVLFEDEHLAIVDKPAGIVVHPGAGRETGTLAHRLLHRYPEIGSLGGPGRPGIVHRLDRDTTGCLAVARSPEAYAGLSRAFAERRVTKLYLAVLYGTFDPTNGTIAEPIGRHPQRRKEMTVTPRGRPAVTHYRVLASADGSSVAEIGLETGRTHQIRVHFKHVRRPLIGDPVYGEARWKEAPRHLRRLLREFARPALHAWRLEVPHPVRERPVAVEAPVPEDLETLWNELAGRSLAGLLADDGGAD